MNFTIYTANIVGNAKNCNYPNKIEVNSPEQLKATISKDHVCATYTNNYRSKENFVNSNVVVMDCDNDHSENPVDWITMELLDDLMPDIEYAITPSRHHMLAKENKSARPRFHVYFPIEMITDADTYSNLKIAIQKRYPFFDANAVDAARFIYGANVEQCLWHEGWVTIDTEVTFIEEDMNEGLILEGSRNNTMSHFAGRVLKRYGNTEKAYEAFMEHANKCNPPLSDDELNTIWSSAIKFYNNKVSSQEGYVSPEEYNEEFKTLKPEDYSDIGEAKILVREYENEILFSSATNFLRYDGRCWQENIQMAIGAIEEFLDLQLKDAQDELNRVKEELINAGIPKTVINAGVKAIQKVISPDKVVLLHSLISAETYLKFVMKHRDYKYIMATANAAKPMISIDVEKLDSNEYLLNTPMATFDLRKGLLGAQPHNAKDFITKITTCSPGEEGKDIWQDSLNLFFGNDKELIEYVQEIVGMAAIGKVYHEHMIIAYGGGANGKSTFWNTIARVLGNYSGKLSAEALTMGCKRNVKPEMAELKGKRFIIASEMEEGMRMNTAVVKQLCSTDAIYAEKKYKDPFSFIPGHTLVLYTNHLPKVGANDDGIWRRLIVIPFNAKITGSSDIKNYTDYLYTHAGSAILSWIIEGAKKAIDHNFKLKIPSIVKNAIEAYREENDWLGIFIDEYCEVEPSLKEKSGEFYLAYRAYCIQTGEPVRSTTDFYGALDKAGFIRKKTNKGSFIYGLKLREGQDFLES